MNPVVLTGQSYDRMVFFMRDPDQKDKMLINRENRDLKYNEEPEGRYADRFKIGYRSCVFILEFDQSFYEDEKERVHTRIITSPEDAKSLLDLLQESIEQYEKNHGSICVEDKDKSSISNNKNCLKNFLKIIRRIGSRTPGQIDCKF